MVSFTENITEKSNNMKQEIINSKFLPKYRFVFTILFLLHRDISIYQK